MADIEITDEMVEVAKGAARAKATVSYASSDECWLIAQAAKAEAREAAAKKADYQAELCKAAQDGDEPDEIDKYGIGVAEDIAAAIRSMEM